MGNMRFNNIDSLVKKVFNMRNNLQLNMGCGSENSDEFINIDIKPMDNVDLIWDINQGLPFDDNSVIYIKAHDFLEHIFDIEYVLKEMYRVSKHGTIWNVRVPHYGSNSVASIQHKHFFGESGFEFFSPSLRNDFKSSWNYGWNIWLELIDRQFILHHAASERFKDPVEREFALIYYRNVIDTMVFTLKVIKNFDDVGGK